MCIHVGTVEVRGKIIKLWIKELFWLMLPPASTWGSIFTGGFRRWIHAKGRGKLEKMLAQFEPIVVCNLHSSFSLLKPKLEILIDLM